MVTGCKVGLALAAAAEGLRAALSSRFSILPLVARRRRRRGLLLLLLLLLLLAAKISSSARPLAKGDGIATEASRSSAAFVVSFLRFCAAACSAALVMSSPPVSLSVVLASSVFSTLAAAAGVFGRRPAVVTRKPPIYISGVAKGLTKIKLIDS